MGQSKAGKGGCRAGHRRQRGAREGGLGGESGDAGGDWHDGPGLSRPRGARTATAALWRDTSCIGTGGSKPLGRVSGARVEGLLPRHKQPTRKHERRTEVQCGSRQARHSPGRATANQKAKLVGHTKVHCLGGGGKDSTTCSHSHCITPVRRGAPEGTG